MTVIRTPEDELRRLEDGQAVVERITGSKSPVDIRHACAFTATVRVRDPYDLTPDAYIAFTAYGATEDEAMRKAYALAHDPD